MSTRISRILELLFDFLKKESSQDVVLRFCRQQIGVGFLMRKMASLIKDTVDITSDGSHWKVASISSFKNHVTEFDIGKEFEEETIEGREMKTTFKLDAGKLIQEQKKIDSTDKDSTITRYVEGDKLIIEMESNGVKAKRVYTKAK
uniref:Lipocalin/cytosolic fatty-acid binding domain-containing protein n=1 Tax=Ditylenchus dipsaci TaxID=166011 RepID=A0A915DPE0_9BILA